MRGGLLHLRTGYGLVLLLAPARVLAALCRHEIDRPACRVARVLGAAS